MARNTNLEQVLFPVGLTEVYHSLPGHPQQAPLFEGQSNHPLQRIPHFLAVTNLLTGQVYCVVTKGYRLVTNQQALDLAGDCFQQLFGPGAAEEMEVFNIHASQSGSYCHVDFIHREYAINLWARETWLPYLRVTNSYNRSRALSFDLGFCRAICNNGMIFEKQTIHYKFTHTSQVIPRRLFQVDFNKFKSMEENFKTSVNRWVNTPIPRSAYLALVCVALQLTFEVNSEDPVRRTRERARWQAARPEIECLVDRYVQELGENAYSLLGVVTELASRPPKAIGPVWMMDTLQRRVGAWFRDFSRLIGMPGFQLREYLAGILLAYD